MSIKSKAKREAKKKLYQHCFNKLKFNEYPHRICKYPKCEERAYTFKYCREHRFRNSVRGAVAKLAREGYADRVARGVYQANEKTGQRAEDRERKRATKSSG